MGHRSRDRSFDGFHLQDTSNELVAGYMNQNTSMFESAHFGDAEDTRPAGAFLEALGGDSDPIQGIVTQVMSRHVSESTPGPTATPPWGKDSVPHGSNWRKRLRELLIRQNESVLSFLLKPAAEHTVLGPVEAVLRRYAIRHDVDTASVLTVKALCSDLSGATVIQEEIEDCLKKRGQSSLSEVRSQVTGLIELYKSTGEKLLDCESKMAFRLEKMDKIQQRVSSLMELQTNDALPAVTAALEKYLEIAFRDLHIETQYKQLLFLYQKHIALREAIQLFKTPHQVISEPMCPICIQETVTTAMSPCGHTFCGGCSKRSVMECFVCRGKIRDRLKLYFS